MVWQLIILQIVTFAILVFLLRQFLYQQVTQSQDRLEQLVQENRKREQELKDTREAMENEFKVKITEHNEEIGKLKAAAESDALKKQDEIIAQAEREKTKIINDAEARQEHLKRQLVAEMEEKAMSLASSIIGRVFTGDVAKGIHKQLTEELIGEIEKTDPSGLQLDAEVVEVSVPFPLGEKQLEKLKEIFSGKLGRSIDINQHIDQELMTGMVVRLGNSVLDGSLKNKLKGAMTHVRISLAR